MWFWNKLKHNIVITSVNTNNNYYLNMLSDDIVSAKTINDAFILALEQNVLPSTFKLLLLKYNVTLEEFLLQATSNILNCIRLRIKKWNKDGNVASFTLDICNDLEIENSSNWLTDASKNCNLNILTWWKKIGLEFRDKGFKFMYSEEAMDLASSNG